MVFQNATIDTTDLPKVEEAEFRGIDRKELFISLGWLSFLYLLLLGGVLAILFLSPLKEYIWGQLLLFGGWLLLASFSFLSTFKGFAQKKYALREHDIIYQRGWIWRKSTSVPFNRIQHASVSQGPFERNFKLSSLHVFTAGGSSSDLTIPGLHIEEAQRIKDFILKHSATHTSSE